MKKIYLLFIVCGLFLVSCGGSGSSTKRSASMCDCVKEAGLDGLDMNTAEEKAEKTDEKTRKKLAQCMANVLEDMEKDMKGMKNKEQKSKYTRELMKGLIDSECADKFFENLPYDDVESMFPLAIQALKSGEATSFSPFGIGVGSDNSYSSEYDGTNECGEYTVVEYYSDEEGLMEEDCFGPGCDCR